MQKSSHLDRNYRRNTWTLQEARSTFQRQMADHARGERLRQLRSQRGLSQEDVAQALGVTAKTYGDWERGGGIRPDNTRRIARYFKVKPAELIDPEIEPASSNGSGPYDPGEMADQLHRIEDMLRTLLEHEGLTPPPLADPPEGPLLSEPEGGQTSPKAARPKAGRRRSAQQRRP